MGHEYIKTERRVKKGIWKIYTTKIAYENPFSVIGIYPEEGEDIKPVGFRLELKIPSEDGSSFLVYSYRKDRFYQVFFQKKVEGPEGVVEEEPKCKKEDVINFLKKQRLLDIVNKWGSKEAPNKELADLLRQEGIIEQKGIVRQIGKTVMDYLERTVALK